MKRERIEARKKFAADLAERDRRKGRVSTHPSLEGSLDVGSFLAGYLAGLNGPLDPEFVLYLLCRYPGRPQ